MGRSTFGNVRQLPSGRWRARFTTTDAAGKRAFHSETFDTKALAVRWLGKQDNAVADGSFIDRARAKVLLADYAEDWLAELIGGRPSSRARDVHYVRSYIIGNPIGRRPIGQVTPTTVRQWAKALERNGGRNGRPLAPATVHKAGHLLGQILEMAVDDQRLTRNPVRSKSVAWPEVVRPDLDVLSVDEVTALADAIDPHYRLFVLTGCATGLRFGELAGLRVVDLELDARPEPRLRVWRNLVEVDGRMLEGPPKTKRGGRFVPLGPALVDQLRAHVAGRDPGEAVFTTKRGALVRNRAFRPRYWDKATRAIGREGFTPHGMRHTAISHWIAHGEDPKAVAEYAGHASVVTVFDRYGHLLPKRTSSAIAALDAERAASALRAEQAQPAPIVPIDVARARR